MRIPIIPTIIVLAAAATMVALGVWQLGRADEKAAMIARYDESLQSTDPVPFPFAGDDEAVWFRNSSVDCAKVRSSGPVSGSSAAGAKGWVMRATCEDPASDQPVTVDLGFSRPLPDVVWQGGPVTGAIAPGPRLVAEPALAGLEPQARPNPDDLPNNHLAYAGQWFFFALTALVIYFLVLRSRSAKRRED